VDYTSERMKYRREEADKLEKEKEAAAVANPPTGTQALNVNSCGMVEHNL